MTDIGLADRRVRWAIPLLAVIVVILAAYFVILRPTGPASYGALDKYVVVQSLDAPEITLVDMRDDTVAGRIALPWAGDSVLIARQIDRILIANHAGRRLGFYDLASQSFEAEIELPLEPRTLVISPDGLTLAIADGRAGRMALVRLAERAVLADFDGIDAPEGMAFSEESDYLYLSDGAHAQIRVFDTNSGLELDPIPLSLAGSTANGQGLSAVTRTPNGLFGATVGAATGDMAVINFRNWGEALRLNIGAGATRPYITADGRFMLVASQTDRTISVISTDTFSRVATLPGFAEVSSIVTGYFETLAFAVSSTERKLRIIDLETMQIAGEIAFEATPGPAIVETDGTRMYVSLRETNELAVIDVANKRIHKIIRGVGASPSALGLASSNNYCH